MIDIPPEVAIKSSIRPGSVYYFPEDSFSSSDPHYFIVINKDPIEDKVIFLVWASSQIEKVKRRRRSCPSETLVGITPDQYEGFIVNSVIDCNKVQERGIETLVDKLKQDKLKIMPEMDVSLVQRLREGVLSSSQIERRIKMMLQD